MDIRIQVRLPDIKVTWADAYISPVELLGLVQRRDLLNDFVNRFLVVWGERTQIEWPPTIILSAQRQLS